MTTVPFLDLSFQNEPLREEIRAALDRVLASGRYTLGPEVEAFEEAFARYCGVQHAVAVNSGTSALHLGLLALGVKPGDEVITVAHSFIAAVETILYCGAVPVFVDIDPETLVMDTALVEAAITERTRAIVPVHLYGNPVDMQALRAVADGRGIPILEDACQAHGALHRGKRVGSWGAAAAFSFYPTKNLGGMGEGGMLVTGDRTVAETVRSLRDHGQSGVYQHGRLGFNYRMTAFQGAVLRVKLDHLNGWNTARRALAARYRECLSGSGIRMVSETAESEPVYHLLVVRVEERERVRAALADRGVQTNIHYPTPIHRQSAMTHAPDGGALPVTEAVVDEVLSLPLFPGLEEEGIEYVADSLRRIVG